jgi:hypothetical protein
VHGQVAGTPGRQAEACGAADIAVPRSLIRQTPGGGNPRSGNPGNGSAPVANSDEQLVSVLATLEECRTALRQAGKDDTAQLVSVAILDVRMKLNHIGHAELKALCEEMLPSDAGTPPRRRPLLRVVK